MFLNKKSAFSSKYHTKSVRHLHKIVENRKWIIIDIRPKPEYEESHIINSINLPHISFRITYPKYINRKQKILLISSTGHTHLDLYYLLKKHNLKAYILEDGWKGIHNKGEYDHLVTYQIFI